MSILDTDRLPGDDLLELRLGDAAERAAAPIARTAGPDLNEDDEDDSAGDGRAPVRPVPAAAAAFLSTAAGGWMLGGVFSGSSARLVGILGALIGAGTVALSYRLRNPNTLQVLALPLAVVAGALLVVPDATGGTANLPSLVVQAIKAGGLTQPPVPFDPGWRFILVVLTCSLSVAAATGAVAFGRSRLAVFLPAPVTVAGVLLQPEGSEVLSVAVALVLSVGALAVSFGGELARDGTTSASFEARRLGRAGGLLVGIVAAMIALAQVGFLFPPSEDSTVIPPKRPQTPPPLGEDRLLLTARLPEPTPLRLGVLDVYDGTAWLTPPYDPKRFVDVADENLPAFADDRGRVGDPQPTPPRTVTVEVVVRDLGQAREVPDLAGTVAVTGTPKGTTFDPRAQTLRFPGRPRAGSTYTITAAIPPTGSQLAQSGAPGELLRPFVEAPSPPPAVRAILDRIPQSFGPYERLQYVRTQYFQKITAAGPGNPVDVTPARVAEFLTGKDDASPYEIAAGEVLMARWAGIPARIGYGYYDDSQQPKDGVYEIRPSDGAMWLEAYFADHGWVPILGKPPKAKSSLNQNKKKSQQILPSGEIQASLYIPIRQEGLQLLYTIVQFWLVRVAPLVGAVLFVWLLLPGLLKSARRIRRRRWAERIGPRARLAVAYAELRDRAIDYNVGHPTLTPLEFLDVIVPDEDHTTMAWLVTRGLWGDLSRDLREEDVETAEQLGRSLVRRFNAGQPLLMRTVAFSSRVSLRDPYDAELPNLYWHVQPGQLAIRIARWPGRTLDPRRLRRLTPSLGRAGSFLLFAVALLTTGCVQRIDTTSVVGAAPLPSVPATVGSVQLQPDPTGDVAFARYRDIALVADMKLYAVRKDGVAVATLQTAAFKPGLRSHNKRVREGVLRSIGGEPTVQRVAGERFYTVTVNEIRILVWFAPDGERYELLAAGKDLAEPERLFAQLIAIQQGRSLDEPDTERGQPPADIRRGTP